MNVLPGSVADTMAPKKRQSVKKKSPSICPTAFMNDTQPYIRSLETETTHTLHAVTGTPHTSHSCHIHVTRHLPHVSLTQRTHPMTKHDMTVPMKA